MENQTNSIKELRCQLSLLISKKEKELNNAPAGTLKVSKYNGKVRYFCRTPETNCIKYIPLEQADLARALAQKDYDQKLLRVLRKKLHALETLPDDLPGGHVKDIYMSLTPERQAFVDPLILTDEQFIERWQNEPYEPLKFREDNASCFYTERGERVRSKSEVIIANDLFHAGIPYKYEAPLRLGEHVIHPDFSVLDIRSRKVKYWEHFGMMSIPEYSANFVSKVQLYENNGLIIGRDVVATFESADQPLDTRKPKQLIEEHFLGPLHKFSILDVL